MNKFMALSSVALLALCPEPVYAERIVLDDGSVIDSLSKDMNDYSYSYLDTDPPATGSSILGGAVLITDGTINSITGNFKDNFAHSDFQAAGAAIANSGGTIGVIDSVFDGNIAKVSYDSQTGNSSAGGGAIYNSGTIEELNGNFLNNQANIKTAEMQTVMGMGGAVWNNGTLGDVNADFSTNSANAGAVNLNSSKISIALGLGGALVNSGTMGNVTGNYDNNKVTGTIGAAIGGAVMNFGLMGSEIGAAGIAGTTDGKYTDNRATVTAGAAAGGAIGNLLGTQESISGVYQDNRAVATAGLAIGGAVGIVAGKTGDITGEYKSNYTNATLGLAAGGAIANALGNVGNIDGTFDDNSVTADVGVAFGGAFASIGTQESIKGTYTNNRVKASLGLGGAIAFVGLDVDLGESTEIPAQIGLPQATKVTADFTGNSVEAYAEGLSNLISGMPENGLAVGGAAAFIGLAEYGKEITPVEFVNSNFYNNKAFSDGGNAWGGAIFGNAIKVTADGEDSVFKNNTANSRKSAIYVQGIDFVNSLIGQQAFSEDAYVTFTAKNGGNVILYDGISGNNYAVNIEGDGSGEVVFYDEIDNAEYVNIKSNAKARLGKNAIVKTTNYSSENGTLTVDIKVDSNGKVVQNALITADGDLVGNTNVIVNSEDRSTFDNAATVFVSAENDDESTAADFEVSRVIGSPYLWTAERNYGGETDGSTWYLVMNDKINPDFGYVPEVIAAIGLHEAAIEQTRTVVRNVSNEVASVRGFCSGCGIYADAWNGEKLRNAWITVNAEAANIDKPVDMEAKIWGVEAGFDIQKDTNNVFGAFVSYRDGEYDLSGDGSKYRAKSGSEIEIDSYLAGLYYRYDKDMNWLFATAHIGTQNAEANTDDGVAEFDTDGIEFGLSAEVGHSFALSDNLTIDPSVGLYYTQINFDDTNDNLGKAYEWDDIKHLEAEAAVKVEKKLENARVYVKPSIIQTLTDDDSVTISKIGEADTYHDQTLGRLEIGGNYGFSDNLSGYVWTNYTFGSSYDAIALGAGVNYAW